VKSLAPLDARAEIIARAQQVRPDNAAQFGIMTAPEMIRHCVISLEAGLGLRPVSSAERLLSRTLIKYIALYAVATLVQRVEEFGARDGNLPWPRHPIFGAMHELEWKRWAYLHTDHHLRQFSA
jgi:hypothetical protein